jgi:hypothetical protein
MTCQTQFPRFGRRLEMESPNSCDGPDGNVPLDPVGLYRERRNETGDASIDASDGDTRVRLLATHYRHNWNLGTA